MHNIDSIIERQLTRESLIKRIDEDLWEGKQPVTFSGQDSERFLANAINTICADGPKSLSLGDLGTYEVVGARSVAGGFPEPKADIAITLKTGQEFGISMKKENFEFLENWMDKDKLYGRLQQVGMTPEESEAVVTRLISQARLSTEQLADVIQREREAFTSRVQELVPGYRYPDRISKDVMNQLAKYDEFRTAAGTFSIGGFKIANYYVKLSGLFGERYGEFLKLIVEGGDDNPKKADGILVADVDGTVKNIEQLQLILDRIKSVETIVKEYKADPKINIAFRLRPITLTRTTYSRTNANKYRVGKRFYENPELGVSWTVSVVSVGAKTEPDEEE